MLRGRRPAGERVSTVSDVLARALVPTPYRCVVSHAPGAVCGRGVMQSVGMYPDPQLLVHLCGTREWQAAAESGRLAPESLLTSGFVHLSTLQQAQLPATRLFAGRTDLLAVYVDPQLLEAPVRWEPGEPDDPPAMRFPHLYGPLPLSAVVEVRGYPPEPDGSFAPLIHSDASGTSSRLVDDC